MKITKIAEIFTRDDVESFDVEEFPKLFILIKKTLVTESSRLIKTVYQCSKINWLKLRVA